MRLLMLSLVLCVCATDLRAQEQTLFSLENQTGGFGAPVVKFTSVNGQTAIMAGGRGGWVFDHSFSIGGGGYGVVSEVDAASNILPIEGPLDIEFGCLGLELEYFFDPASLTHYTVSAFVGVGATNFVKDVGSVFESNQQTGETAFMFLLEPGVHAELNLAKTFRLNAGVSYRLAMGTDQVGLDDSDFSGFSASLELKIGTF
ncbi:MAG: hypothetical protein A2X67_00845 [Ignavibacteria bacterium GWA2_55_11]|nr:MAG: hypothetical protein A2X67_00845 [Ignavibacteria bacterium GWA2_55_11]HAV22196.1 hypothetical protein [Bacteroidota bacterium]